MKKSQVTPFIISALVVLIMFIILYNYKIDNSEIDNSNIEDESLLPLTTYVQDIVETIVNEEISKILFYGQIPDANKSEMTIKGYTNFEYLGIDFYAWDYKTYPEKEEFEDYLSKTITSKLDNIFENEYLSKYYNIDELSQFIIFTTIKNNSIQIHLNKKLNVTKIKDQSSTQINEFFVSVSTDFGTLLNEAYDVYDYLVNDSVLETFAMQTILAGDFHVDGMDFDCLQKRFKISDLEEKYMEASLQHFSFLNYRSFIDSLSDNFEYKNYYQHYALNNSNTDYKMSIKLFDPIEFSANPSTNGFIEPMTTSVESSLMSTFCMNVFHEFYTIRQPLIISLFYNNLEFKLPLIIDISNNNPKKERHSIYMDEENMYSSSFCENKVSENTTIAIINKKTAEYLDNVSVDVKCLDYYLCPLGEVQEGIEQGVPYLKTELPRCDNYKFVLSKDGFYKTTVYRTSEELQQNEIFNIIPLINVTFQFDLLTKMIDGSESYLEKTSLAQDEFLAFSYGDEIAIFNETIGSVEIPYIDNVYEMKVLLNDNNGNIKYYSENKLNVTINDLNNLDGKVSVTLYGQEGLDYENSTQLYDLMKYAQNNKEEIKIR